VVAPAIGGGTNARPQPRVGCSARHHRNQREAAPVLSGPPACELLLRGQALPRIRPHLLSVRWSGAWRGTLENMAKMEAARRRRRKSERRRLVGEQIGEVGVGCRLSASGSKSERWRGVGLFGSRSERWPPTCRGANRRGGRRWWQFAKKSLDNKQDRKSRW
jgi:hypothetical protein